MVVAENQFLQNYVLCFVIMGFIEGADSCLPPTAANAVYGWRVTLTPAGRLEQGVVRSDIFCAPVSLPKELAGIHGFPLTTGGTARVRQSSQTSDPQWNPQLLTHVFCSNSSSTVWAVCLNFLSNSLEPHSNIFLVCLKLRKIASDARRRRNCKGDVVWPTLTEQFRTATKQMK